MEKTPTVATITIRIFLEELRILLLPWYLQVKCVHLFMVAMWSFSTAVAYRNFIVPAFRAWQFFRVSTPLIVFFVPLVFYLAVTKPA